MPPADFKNPLTALQPHLRLSGRISEAHFARWLGLFRQTVDELMPNPAAADFFYDRANMIGRNFQAMIFALNS